MHIKRAHCKLSKLLAQTALNVNRTISRNGVSANGRSAGQLVRLCGRGYWLTAIWFGYGSAMVRAFELATSTQLVGSLSHSHSFGGPTNCRRAARVWWLREGCHFQCAFSVICWYTKWIVFLWQKFFGPRRSDSRTHTAPLAASIKPGNNLCAF